MFGSLDISVSAVTAQRTRIDTIAGNIANASATADPAGDEPLYRRRVALFSPGDTADGRNAPGVHVARIIEDPAGPRYVFDEFHPHAIRSGPRKGYVAYPNVDLATEMINAMEAVRAYEANITVMDMTKTMASAQLELLT
jgi:flagellar basal-body rod protein FlgC